MSYGDEWDEEGLAGGAGGQVFDRVSQFIDQVSMGVDVVEIDSGGSENDGEDDEDRSLRGRKLAIVGMVEGKGRFEEERKTGGGRIGG